MEYQFDIGGMWEDGTFYIRTNEEISEMSGITMCKHCRSKETKLITRYDKSTYEEISWICPRVVVSYNEGGHNSTGVCLDCIIEANQTINP